MVFGHEPPSIRKLVRSKGVRRLCRAMESLPEPKQEGKTRHPTWRCLLIVLLSLTNGRDWVLDAHSFAVKHEKKLSKLFGEGYLIKASNFLPFWTILFSPFLVTLP